MSIKGYKITSKEDKPGGSGELSVQVNNLAASMESFAASPENGMLKNQVINDAVILSQSG
jgi:hypothetical protein